MSDTMTVRQACEHGNYDEHWTDTSCWERCPGGKEIILRRTKTSGGPSQTRSTSTLPDYVWVEADDEAT